MKVSTTLNAKLGNGVALSWQEAGHSHDLLIHPGVGSDVLLDFVKKWIKRGYTAEQIATLACSPSIARLYILRFTDGKKNDLKDGTAAGEVFEKGVLTSGERYRDDTFTGLLSTKEMEARRAALMALRPATEAMTAEELERARVEREMRPFHEGIPKPQPVKTLSFEKPKKKKR